MGIFHAENPVFEGWKDVPVHDCSLVGLGGAIRAPDCCVELVTMDLYEWRIQSFWRGASGGLEVSRWADHPDSAGHVEALRGCSENESSQGTSGHYVIQVRWLRAHVNIGNSMGIFCWACLPVLKLGPHCTPCVAWLRTASKFFESSLTRTKIYLLSKGLF